MRWIRINILKCTLVFCLACGFSFAKTPCTNMSDKLSAAQRDSLQNNIKRQLKTERLNILEFFKEQNSSIVYIETYGADEAFIFILEMSLRMILSQYGVVRLKYQRKKI